MRITYKLAALGVATLWTIGALAARAPQSILSLPHKEVKLQNGLRIYMVKYPSPGVVSYQLPVRVGSRNEVEAGKSGFAHFFEHLMFRGTKKRTAKEFGQLYVKLGCENNAWTDYDMTNYHGLIAAEYLPKILEAEADRFANLSFDEKALRDEAGAVLGEYNKDVAQPEFMLEEKLMATAFQVHTYGHTTMGYKEDILKFGERYKDVWPFFHRYYRPSNVAIVLVGDIDFDRELSTIKKYFGGWKDPNAVPSPVPVEAPQTEARHAEVRLDKPTQTRVVVSFKVPAFTTANAESASLALLSEMYFSVTSDFQKEFRFDKKWVDDVSAWARETRDPGLWTIAVRLSATGEGKEDEIKKAIENTVLRMSTQGIDTLKMRAAKDRIRNDALSNWFDTPEGLAGRIAWYTGFESDLGVLDRVLLRVQDVQLDDLAQFARRYLQETRKTTVILKGKSS